MTHLSPRLDGWVQQSPSARRPPPRRRGGKRPHWRQRLADIATGLACPFHSGAARVLRGGEGDRGGLGSGGGVRLARCATSPRMPRSFCSSPQPTMHALRRIFTTRSGWSLSSGGTLPQERRRLLHPPRYAYGSRRRSAAAAEAAQELEEDGWADEARGIFREHEGRRALVDGNARERSDECASHVCAECMPCCGVGVPWAHTCTDPLPVRRIGMCVRCAVERML